MASPYASPQMFRDRGRRRSDLQVQQALSVSDSITLRMNDNQFLSADGFFDALCVLRTRPDDMDASVFRICPQYQYTAAQELDDYNAMVETSNSARGSAAAITVHEKNRQAAEQRTRQNLQRGARNEEALNVTRTEKLAGTSLLYGDVIQLQHVRSGQFLTVGSAGDIAECERDALRVFLSSGGSERSWFAIESAFKMRTETDECFPNQPIILRASNMNMMFLRGTGLERPLRNYIRTVESGGKLPPEVEVNCSLESTSWKMCLYSKYRPDKTLLRAGDVIYLREMSFGHALGLPMFSDEGSAVAAQSVRLLRKRDVAEVATSSNALWVVERADSTAGGVLSFAASSGGTSAQPFRLRYLNTGQYLSMRHPDVEDKAANILQKKVTGGVSRQQLRAGHRTDPLPPINKRGGGGFMSPMKRARDDELQFIVSVTNNRDEYTLFDIHRTTADSKAADADDDDVHDHSRCHISSANRCTSSLWLSANTPTEVARGIFAERDKSTRFVIERAPLGVVNDVMASLFCLARITWFFDSLFEYKGPADAQKLTANERRMLGTIDLEHRVQSKGEEMLGGFAKTHSSHHGQEMESPQILEMSHTLMFLTDFVTDADNAETFYATDSHTITLAKKSRRQNMMQELGLLDISQGLLAGFSALSASNLPSANVLWQKQGWPIDTNKEIWYNGPVQRVANDLLGLLHASAHGHESNQLYLANELGGIVKHIWAGAWPMQILRHMLESNLQLQREKITVNVLEEFVRLLAESPLTHDVLRLLSSLCHCQTDAVEKNQCQIAKLLFDDHMDKLMPCVPVVAESTAGGGHFQLSLPTSICDAPGGLELFKSFNKQRHFTLAALVKKLPKSSTHESRMKLLKSSARAAMAEAGSQHSSRNYRERELLGRLSPPLGPFSNGGDGKENAAWAQIYDFFTAQVDLVACLCYGRNYITIERCREMLPASCVMEVIKDDSVPGKLRGAFVHVMRNMYADCSPRSFIASRSLAILWEDIGTGATTGDPSGETKSGTTTTTTVEDERDDFDGNSMNSIVASHLQFISVKKPDLPDGPIIAADGQWGDFEMRCTDLLSLMVKFGIYEKREEIETMKSLLVKCVDWRESDSSKKAHEFGRRLNRSASMRGGVANVQQKFSAFKFLPRKSALILPSAGHSHDDLGLVLVDDVEEKNLREKWLDIIDGVPAMVFVLSLVLLLVVLTAVRPDVDAPSASSGPNSSTGVNAYDAFDYFATVFFVIEMLLRMWCVNDFKTWSTDVFAVVDLVVVVIDLMTYAIQADGADSVGTFSKAARSVRTIRLVRLVRAAKAARVIGRLASRLLVDVRDHTEWTLSARHCITDQQGLGTSLSTLTKLVTVLNLFHERKTRLDHEKICAEFKSWHDARAIQPNLSMRSIRLRNSIQQMKHRSSSMRENAGDAGDVTERSEVDLFYDATNGGGGGGDSWVVQWREETDVLVDLLLFNNRDLVKAALKSLMLHCSPEDGLLKCLEDTQIVDSSMVAPDREPARTFETKEERYVWLKHILPRFDFKTKKARYVWLKRLLLELDVLAEKSELWGDDANKKCGQVCARLESLIEIINVQRSMRAIDPIVSSSGSSLKTTVHADSVEVQTSLRHLDALDVGIALLETSKSGLDNNIRETHVQEIARLTCLFIASFVHRHPENQELAFKRIDFFALYLEDTHIVIAEICGSNNVLAKQVPKALLRRLCNGAVGADGCHNPDFLVPLRKICDCGDGSNLDNEVLVVQELSNDFSENVNNAPADLARGGVDEGGCEAVLLLCQKPGSEEYLQRIKWMEMCASCRTRHFKSGDAADWPAEVQIANNCLQYHVNLLELLTACTRYRVTANVLEAKVRSLYDAEDVVHALMDKNTIIEVKIHLARYLLASAFDVGAKLDSLVAEPYVWGFLVSCGDSLEDFIQAVRYPTSRRASSTEILQAIASSPKPTTSVSAAEQNLAWQQEYCLATLLPMIRIFFDEHVGQDQASWLRFPGEFECQVTPEGSMLAGEALVELAQRLYESVKALFFVLVEKKRPVGKNQQGEIKRTLNVLILILDMSVPSFDPQEARRAVEQLPWYGVDKERPLGDHGFVRQAFKSFVEQIRAGRAKNGVLDRRNAEFVSYMATLKRLDDDAADHIRLEPLIGKLVDHVQRGIRLSKTCGKVSPDEAEVFAWLLRIFRGMIERSWGRSEDGPITVFCRDEQENGDECDAHADEILSLLHSCRVDRLCLDLAVAGVQKSLSVEALTLGLALLFREGGNKEVQDAMADHLTVRGDAAFFLGLKARLKEVSVLHDLSNSGVPLTPAEGRDAYVVHKFMQQICEGHNCRCQVLMRDQPQNTQSVNLVTELVTQFRVVSLARQQLRTKIAQTKPGDKSADNSLGNVLEIERGRIKCLKSACDVLIELTQGPCRVNQEHLAAKTDCVELINRMLRARISESAVFYPSRRSDQQLAHKSDDNLCAEVELQVKLLRLVQALLEGQVANSAVVDRVTSVIALDTLKILQDYAPPKRRGRLQTLAESLRSEQELLAVHSLVLSDMLLDLKPSLEPTTKQPGIDGGGADDGDGARGSMEKHRSVVREVEIVWDGRLYSNFFHVPRLARTIPLSQKYLLWEKVDISSPELKLHFFVGHVQDTIHLMEHQATLEAYHVDGVFSSNVHLACMWISFTLALVCNCLLLYSFEYSDPHPYPGEPIANGFKLIFAGSPLVHRDAQSLVSTVQGLQVALSCFTLLQSLVIRAPVVFQARLSAYRRSGGHKNQARLRALVVALLDTEIAYRLVYFVFCLIAVNETPLVSALLLLDIVYLNGTTRAVLLAVYNPARQLMMTIVFGIFVIYIFSFVNFLQFPGDAENDECETLKSCFMMTLNFGMRNGGGIGDHLGFDSRAHDIDRYAYDLLFYILMLVVLLNIIFGIIIDTFSELRSDKNRRKRDANEVCFICGLEKGVFESQLGAGSFKKHVDDQHNMWSYARYIAFLHCQDRDLDNGLEAEIRTKLEQRDISWFPIRQTTAFQDMDLHTNKDLAASIAEIGTSSEELAARVADLGQRLDRVLDLVAENGAGPSEETDGGRFAKAGQKILAARKMSSQMVEPAVSPSFADAAAAQKSLALWSTGGRAASSSTQQPSSFSRGGPPPGFDDSTSLIEAGIF